MRLTVVAMFFGLVAGVLCVGSAFASAQTAPKPNFVFILADDMRAEDLRYMPKTNALLGDGGMSFGSAFVSDPVCCPSRATIMRGQYAHNTGVWFTGNGAEGGWQAYQDNGGEQDNVATRLNDAGYRTALLGKYINGYHEGATHVPPGWDRWFATFSSNYFRYYANDNGTIEYFGGHGTDYLTDVLKKRTKAFVRTSVARGEPFFAYVAPKAPHLPATPAPRHRGAYEGLQAPRPPSFDEEDVDDKPPWVRSRPRLTETTVSGIDRRHGARAESLMALDDLVEGVVDKLRDLGALENTYVVFTSDNGWHEGEHRLPKGKGQPYEESVRVPLVIRGPGVQAGSATDALVLNTDYLPTFTDLAGAPTPDYVDGRSLSPLFGGDAAGWRDAVLLERRDYTDPDRSFYAVRTGEGKKYVEYEGGFRELYDLGEDPYELANLYDATPPPAGLERRLRALQDCAGASCRAAEDGP